MSKSLKRLEKMGPLTEDTLKEYNALAKDTRALVKEVSKTNASVQQLADATRATIPKLERTNDEFQNTARTWNKLGERLNVLLESNQDKVVKALDNLNETLMRVNNVFNDENQKNLSATLKNVRVGSDRLDSITKHT